MPADLSAQFAAFFAEFMNPDEARGRASRIATTLNATALLALLSELRGRSCKVAALAIEMFPALVDVLDEAELVLWIDLAISLTERSGAIAMKYCRERRASRKSGNSWPAARRRAAPACTRIRRSLKPSSRAWRPMWMHSANRFAPVTSIQTKTLK